MDARRVPRQQWPNLEEKLGFIPMFPVPSTENDTATTMGGWLLSTVIFSKDSQEQRRPSKETTSCN